jgi:uncharacterized glyoxalase superfamily protein PhnB
MLTKAVSACITTNKLAETRAFYTTHFGARVAFDCGWYINLQFGDSSVSLQFMSPQHGQVACNPSGLTYNFKVADVDMEYARLVTEGLQPLAAPENHPWGDRAFAVQDPSGVMLYIYTECEPAPEYRDYYK